MTTMRWYHYCMFQLPVIIGVVALSLILVILQTAVYSSIDTFEQTFSGECDLLDSYTSSNDEIIKSAALKCGKEIIPTVGDLSDEVLHILLTTNERPTIICTRFVSVYLNDKSLTCKIKETQT